MMYIEKVLVVDDELIMRQFISETLIRKNIEVVTAENGQKALAALKNNTFDLIFTDMKMPDMTGIDLLKKVKELCPNTVVIVITAFASVENAVEAMRLGAYNYLIKPFTPDTIEALLDKIQEHRLLVEENSYLRSQITPNGSASTHSFIAQSPSMKAILQDVERVAKSNASIFITGESGTGKEVVASTIHAMSLRAERPFIKVNCAAIPETLIESEFFGHEKGAFTGAHTKRLGRFELANKGTLLLDEITEVPIMLQAKLLRVIQEQEFERVGGARPVKVDVRLISTSNRNIEEAIERKILREDLFYRLNVVPIHLPPLRNRKEDIICLAEYFIEKCCIESHLPIKTLAESTKEKLYSYHWPGNVRELANIIERAVVMGQGEIIKPESIYLGNAVEKTTPSQASSSESRRRKEAHLPIGITLKELEKKLIIETLEAQKNNRTKTAQILDISVRTLRNKLKEYMIDEENSEGNATESEVTQEQK
jgi:two-component system response regulator AtoC